MKEVYTIQKLKDYNTAAEVVLKYMQDEHLTLEQLQVCHNFSRWLKDKVDEGSDYIQETLGVFLEVESKINEE